MALTDPINENKIYAKVENGKVIEYPVFELHIKNRSHPIDWYTPCLLDKKPILNKYQYTKEVLEVLNDKVLVHYEVYDYTLPMVLDTFKDKTSIMMSTPVDISTLTTEDINVVTDLASKHVQKLLDDFARTKGYDDIKSVVTYLNSTVPAYAAEATTAVSLRDQCWNNLSTYLSDVQTGTVPVPISVEEIEAVLPALVW